MRKLLIGACVAVAVIAMALFFRGCAVTPQISEYHSFPSMGFDIVLPIDWLPSHQTILDALESQTFSPGGKTGCVGGDCDAVPTFGVYRFKLKEGENFMDTMNQHGNERLKDGLYGKEAYFADGPFGTFYFIEKPDSREYVQISIAPTVNAKNLIETIQWK